MGNILYFPNAIEKGKYGYLRDVIGLALTISVIAFLLIINEGTVDSRQLRKEKCNYKEHLKN